MKTKVPHADDNRPTVPPERWRDRPRVTDVDQLTGLLAETGMFSPDEIDIAAELAAAPPEEGYLFHLVEVAGRLVGFACYGRIPGTVSSFDLYWIAVRPSAQHNGFGRRLLGAVEASAAAAGGTRLFIDTSARAQYAPTHAFYRAAGYTLAAELADFYRPGEAKYIFSKALRRQRAS